MAEMNIPKLGKVNKKVTIGVGVIAASYVGYRYYQARNGSGADTTAVDETTGDFGTGGTVPDVLGSVSPTNSYGIPDNSTPASTTDYGFTGTTNAQWSQYVSTLLSQSDKWSYTDIVTALGAYLAGSPLTSLQKQIVQSALSLGGNPPVGTHVVVSGGDTAMTIAPSGVTAKPINGTSISASWNPVAGAAGYHLYIAGSNVIRGESTSSSGIIGGLDPGKSYSIQVAAHTGSGQTGPKSTAVSAKTANVALRAPTGLSAGTVTTTALQLKWGAVPGADHYEVARNGRNVGATHNTFLQQTGLKPGTRYTFNVWTIGQGAKSAKSQTLSVTTKKK